MAQEAGRRIARNEDEESARATQGAIAGARSGPAQQHFRLSTCRSVWLGELEREKPREGKPAQLLVMPETVFSGLHVQPEPCGFMKEAIADGRLFVTRDPRAAAERLPLQRAAVK